MQHTWAQHSIHITQAPERHEHLKQFPKPRSDHRPRLSFVQYTRIHRRYTTDSGFLDGPSRACLSVAFIPSLSPTHKSWNLLPVLIARMPGNMYSASLKWERKIIQFALHHSHPILNGEASLNPIQVLPPELAEQLRPSQ